VVGSTKIGVFESIESATRRFFRLQHLRTGASLNVNDLRIADLGARHFPANGLVRSCIKWEHDVELSGNPDGMRAVLEMCNG